MFYDQDKAEVGRLLGLDIVDWSMLLVAIGLTALIVVLAWNRIKGAGTDHERPSPAEDRSGSLHRPSRSGFCNRIYVAVFAVFRGVVSVWEASKEKGSSEKLRHTLHELEYLLLRFRAFGHLRLQPLAARWKQLFKGLADCGIGVKVSGNLSNSSVISIRGRPVIAANCIAQTTEQGV
jgi:hypothetical protein